MSFSITNIVLISSFTHYKPGILDPNHLPDLPEKLPVWEIAGNLPWARLPCYPEAYLTSTKF